MTSPFAPGFGQGAAGSGFNQAPNYQQGRYGAGISAFSVPNQANHTATHTIPSGLPHGTGRVIPTASYSPQNQPLTSPLYPGQLSSIIRPQPPVFSLPHTTTQNPAQQDTIANDPDAARRAAMQVVHRNQARITAGRADVPEQNKQNQQPSSLLSMSPILSTGPVFPNGSVSVSVSVPGAAGVPTAVILPFTSASPVPPRYIPGFPTLPPSPVPLSGNGVNPNSDAMQKLAQMKAAQSQGQIVSGGVSPNPMKLNFEQPLVSELGYANNAASSAPNRGVVEFYNPRPRYGSQPAKSIEEDKKTLDETMKQMREEQERWLKEQDKLHYEDLERLRQRIEEKKKAITAPFKPEENGKERKRNSISNDPTRRPDRLRHSVGGLSEGKTDTTTEDGDDDESNDDATTPSNDAGFLPKISSTSSKKSSTSSTKNQATLPSNVSNVSSSEASGKPLELKMPSKLPASNAEAQKSSKILSKEELDALLAIPAAPKKPVQPDPSPKSDKPDAHDISPIAKKDVLVAQQNEEHKHDLDISNGVNSRQTNNTLLKAAQNPPTRAGNVDQVAVESNEQLIPANTAPVGESASQEEESAPRTKESGAVTSMLDNLEAMQKHLLMFDKNDYIHFWLRFDVYMKDKWLETQSVEWASSPKVYQSTHYKASKRRHTSDKYLEVPVTLVPDSDYLEVRRNVDEAGGDTTEFQLPASSWDSVVLSAVWMNSKASGSLCEYKRTRQELIKEQQTFDRDGWGTGSRFDIPREQGYEPQYRKKTDVGSGWFTLFFYANFKANKDSLVDLIGDFMFSAYLCDTQSFGVVGEDPLGHPRLVSKED